MSQKILGGTPYKRYPDPSVSNLPNEYGLYPWSAFRATIAYINPDNGDVEPQNGASQLTGILFTSDLPAIITYSSINGGLTTSGLGRNTLSSPILRTTKGSIITGLPVVTLSAYGQVASGYSGNAGTTDVPVSGFPFEASIGESYDVCFLDCIANSPTICSPIGNAWAGTGASATPIGEGSSPILLLYEQYTNTIRNNNNIIEASGYSYIVVGIYKDLA